MLKAYDLPERTPAAELAEGVLFYPVALVVSATVLPGVTICIPGLIFAVALILIPLAAIAIVVLAVAAVVAAPVLLVRQVRRHAGSFASAREDAAGPLVPRLP